MGRILIEWKKKINILKHSIKFKRAGGFQIPYKPWIILYDILQLQLVDLLVLFELNQLVFLVEFLILI